MSDLKKSDQIRLLENQLVYTDTGKSEGMFTYPNCPFDLYTQGLVTDEGKITIAGRALLWHLNKGPDPTNSKASIEFKLEEGHPITLP
jgi:hypothetical protein